MLTTEKQPQAHPSIQTLTPYQPGKPIEDLQRELGLKNIIKLASNENPLGPSPKGLAAAQESLPGCALYPDPAGFALKAALSKKFNTSPNCITLGDGSDNLLALVTQAYVGAGDHVMVPQYGFATFSIVTKGVEGVPKVVPATEWHADLHAMAEAITEQTKVVFIANPNNPTGTWVTQSALTDFLNRIPSDVIVVLDEAYYEFCEHADYPDTVALQADFSNLITSRTFSKAYGLAGLRIGYMIASPEITDILNRIRLPFNVSVPGLAAATAALGDEGFIQKTLENNRVGMQLFIDLCDELKLEYIPSVCNFLTIDMGQAALPIYEALLQRGIIVRPLGPYQLPNHLRISIGLPEENARLVEAMTDIVKG